MNKIISMMVALVVALFAANSFAWTPPTSPAPASWVSDQSHVLSDEAHSRLDAKLKQINQSSANEIAVLVLPSLDGENISDVGYSTAKAWGVGKSGLDNGVLVVLSMKEHKSRIEVGKGAEGDLPDLKCHDILQNTLAPYMRKHDVEGGLSATVEAISSSIASHKADVAAGRTSSSNQPICDVNPNGVGAGTSDNGLLLLLTFGLLGIGMWWVIANIRRSKRRQQEELDRLDDELRARQIRAEKEAARRVELNKPTPHVEFQDVQDARYAERLENERIETVTNSSASTIPVVLLAEEESRQAEDRRHQEEARRKRDEEERRKRDEDSTPSNSFDFGGGSGGGFDGGGFGGGDFGGGGSSGDW